MRLANILCLVQVIILKIISLGCPVDASNAFSNRLHGEVHKTGWYWLKYCTELGAMVHFVYTRNKYEANVFDIIVLNPHLAGYREVTWKTPAVATGIDCRLQLLFIKWNLPMKWWSKWQRLFSAARIVGKFGVYWFSLVRFWKWWTCTHLSGIYKGCRTSHQIWGCMSFLNFVNS